MSTLVVKLEITIFVICDCWLNIRDTSRSNPKYQNFVKMEVPTIGPHTWTWVGTQCKHGTYIKQTNVTKRNILKMPSWYEHLTGVANVEVITSTVVLRALQTPNIKALTNLSSLNHCKQRPKNFFFVSIHSFLQSFHLKLESRLRVPKCYPIFNWDLKVRHIVDLSSDHYIH